MKKLELYKGIAVALVARHNCIQNGNAEWEEKWDDLLDEYESHLPSGSGFDAEFKIDRDESDEDAIVLNSSYHVMNEHGYYNGWIDFSVVVKPSLLFDYNVSVRGKFGKRQDLKGYIMEVMEGVLRTKVGRIGGGLKGNFKL